MLFYQKTRKKKQKTKNEDAFRIFKRILLVVTGGLFPESFPMYSRIESVFTCNKIILCFPGVRSETRLSENTSKYMSAFLHKNPQTWNVAETSTILLNLGSIFPYDYAVMISTVYRNSVVEVHTSSRSKHNSWLKNTPFCNV